MAIELESIKLSELTNRIKTELEHSRKEINKKYNVQIKPAHYTGKPQEGKKGSVVSDRYFAANIRTRLKKLFDILNLPAYALDVKATDNYVISKNHVEYWRFLIIYLTDTNSILYKSIHSNNWKKREFFDGKSIENGKLVYNYIRMQDMFLHFIEVLSQSRLFSSSVPRGVSITPRPSEDGLNVTVEFGDEIFPNHVRTTNDLRKFLFQTILRGLAKTDKELPVIQHQPSDESDGFQEALQKSLSVDLPNAIEDIFINSEVKKRFFDTKEIVERFYKFLRFDYCIIRETMDVIHQESSEIAFNKLLNPENHDDVLEEIHDFQHAEFDEAVRTMVINWMATNSL